MTQTLITRLSKLDAPDSDVDAEIAMQVCGFTRKNLMENFPEENPLWEYFDQERNLIGRHGPMIPRYTASVDAVIALAERVLPGKGIDLLREAISELGKKYHWHICLKKPEQVKELPIQVCIALSRAKEASHGQ